MVAAPTFSVSKDFHSGLDHLLLEICEEVQITPARYDLAVERYGTLNKLLEGNSSPFQYFRPEIYPQGSMALGTTVAPLDGPHDLDFVLQLSRDYSRVDPMGLIRTLYEFLRQHGTYRPMTTLKNRCVRIEYADEFYMDVLPACENGAAASTCIKVPDCAVRGWSDSNPRGYIKWFEDQSKRLFVDRLLEKAEPIPDQQAVTEKNTLQLIVQLTKRWRDRYYADVDSDLAPISIVLTTLAAGTYRGERSASKALASMLSSVVRLIDESQGRGERHLALFNPSNRAEDLTERWDSNPAAYDAFARGVRDFHLRWSQLIARQGNVNAELESLFGETVTSVLRKRTKQIQESRQAGNLGVTASGLITSSARAVAKVQPNTFHGTQ